MEERIMCRKLVVTNRLSLGNRELGWEAYSLPKGEVVEFTSRQLKDILRSGGDEVYGLALSGNGELVFDREGFYTRNMMNKLHINTLVPMEETECLANLFYIIIGEREGDGGKVYDAVSSRYERTVFTEEKAKLLLEMDIISGGAKLENGKVVAAPMEKSRAEAADVKKDTMDGVAGTAGMEPEAGEKKAKNRKKDM